MTASDIAEFVPCSRDTSYKIFKAIRAQNKCEGIENITNVILTKRVMDYLKIDESQIKKEMKEIETNEERRR
jgi:predicted transcriptional regulator